MPDTVVVVCQNLAQLFHPIGGRDTEVQESFHYIVFFNLRCVRLQIVAYLRSYLFGDFTGKFYEREYYQSEVSFELFLGFLYLDKIVVHLRSVEVAYCFFYVQT